MNNISFTFDSRLDTDFLNSIYEDDFEHAGIVFEQFLEVSPKQMDEIEQRFAEGAIEPFRQAVHKVKPVFSFVGLTNLTTKAETIEKRCKEIGSLQEIAGLYTDLKNDFLEFLPLIREESARLKR